MEVVPLTKYSICLVMYHLEKIKLVAPTATYLTFVMTRQRVIKG